MEVSIRFGFLPIIFHHKTKGNMEKGKKLYEAGHVLDLLEKGGTITAKIIRQTSVSLKPYSVLLNLNGDRNVVTATCQCIAGVTGFCKHISAVVFAINEENCLTKTSFPCEWNKPSSSKSGQLKYSKGKRFDEMYKPAKRISKFTPHQLSLEDVLTVPCMLRTMLKAEAQICESTRWYKKGNNDAISGKAIMTVICSLLYCPCSCFCCAVLFFRDVVSEAALTQESAKLREEFKMLVSRQDLCELIQELNKQPLNLVGDCCVTTFNKRIFGDAGEVCLETFYDIEKWKKERQFRITASRCYELYTYSKADWEIKIMKYFWPKQFQSKYTDHGLKWESEARDIYSLQDGVYVLQTGLIVCQSETWLAVSPDGVVFENGVPVKLLEIKCPFKGKYMSSKNIEEFCPFLERDNNTFVLKRKHSYYAQIQICMSILNLHSCDFMVFCSYDKSFIIINVLFDYEVAKDILFKLKKNYFENMLHYLCTN